MFIGLSLLFVGLSIRLIALATVGKSFTASVVEIKKGKLATTGLYNIVRHSSYLGAYAIFIGSNLLLETYISLILTTITLFWVYKVRIRYEEEKLVTYFGKEYKEYIKSTPCFIPYTGPVHKS